MAVELDENELKMIERAFRMCREDLNNMEKALKRRNKDEFALNEWSFRLSYRHLIEVAQEILNRLERIT